MITLCRDGKEIMTGTELEILQYIHQHHCYSLDHALKYEGYSIKEEMFKDSPQIAKRDSTICDLHYSEGVFRQFFTSPFKQYAEYIGKSFTVVKQLREIKLATEDEEGQDDMYLIRFEDGTEIEAFGHEVCVLDYEKCLPKVS